MAAVLEEYQRPVAGGEIDTIRALLHDLRQPLAAILLLAGTDAGDVSRKLEVITGQARWLADLVETVLSEASGDDVGSTDVAPLVEGVVARASTTAECAVTLEGPDALEVWARPVALSRALACVLDNAIRAAGAHGRVSVRMSHRHRRHARRRSPTTVPASGKVAGRTSLGLTTTRAMVAACQGSFQLHSGERGGAVADICLAGAAAALGRVMRIVVCDDHLLLLEALGLALEASGHEVVALASHPDEARRGRGSTTRMSACSM